jgi:hypothetical protein
MLSRFATHIIAALMLGSILVLGGAGAANAGASAPDAAVAEICAQAQQLLDGDDPTTALALIDAIREGGGEDRATACDEEWLQATAATAGASQSEAMMLGEIPASEVCTIAEALEEQELFDEALSVIDDARAAAVEKVTGGDLTFADYAEACGTERERIDAALENAEKTSPEAVGEAWDDFVTESILPLTSIGLFGVGLWIAILIVARLCAQLWPMTVPSTRRERVLSAWIGAALALIAPGITVGIVASQAIGPDSDASRPFSRAVVNFSLLGTVALTALFAVLAVFLLSFAFATRRRVQIDVVGDEEDSALAVVAELQAILNDVGGEPARGLEVPVGPDLADLDVSVFDVGNVSKLLGLIQNVWKTISSISPWKVLVKVEADSASAAFRISRNGHVVAADRVALDDVRLPLEGATHATNSQRIATVIVGRVVASLARAYSDEWKHALHGATEADGITLQYLATRWHASFAYRQTGIELLARALDIDPLNRSAQVALWNLQYRDKTEREDLELYNQFVVEMITSETNRDSRPGRDATPADLATNDLLIRLLITQGALARNLDAVGRAVTREDLARARLLLGVLAERDEHALEARWKGAARINFRRLTKALGGSPAIKRAGVIKPGPLTPGDIPGTESSDPADGSPEVAYSLACHIVRSRDSDHAALFGVGQPLPRLLAVAFADVDTRWWAGEDPELTCIRDLDEFRRMVGNAHPTSTPISDETGLKLYQQSQKVDRLDGYAGAASVFVASLGLREVESLAEIHGSPSWDRVLYKLYRHLADHHGYRGDPTRVMTWLRRVASVEPPPLADDKNPAPKVETVAAS